MFVIPAQSCTLRHRGRLDAPSDVCGLEPEEPQTQGGSSVEPKKCNMQCRSARNMESFEPRFRDFG